MNRQDTGGKAKRRKHELAFKRELIERCLRPGASVSAIALENGLNANLLFKWRRTHLSRSVLMSADLWRELSLLGHWIVDAVIVRWAALTERFAHRQGISSGAVLPLLLARPDPDRVTAVARGIYLAAHTDRCVWSGRRLGVRNFVVDHAIPFSLWGNNDLWNLLPADADINARKSDKLPTAELLKASQAQVVDNWKLTREAMPQAFDRQAVHLLGHELRSGKAWEGELFARLREAIELTALQRGIERWSGPLAAAA